VTTGSSRSPVTTSAGRRLDASCALHGGDAPVAGHECGIYAFRTRELARDLLRRYTGVRQPYGPVPEEPPPRLGRPVALGRVLLWGRILVRDHGFRAQFGYLYDLFLIGGDQAIAAGLRPRYAVDVTVAA
jgi:hypothetical protein